MLRKTLVYFIISMAFTLLLPIFIAGLAAFQEMEYGPIEMFWRVATAPFFLFIAITFSAIRTAYAWFMKFRKDGDEGDSQTAHDAVVHDDDGGFGFG
ncbi:MAG: hypothetical protein CMK09_05705 [Ponticaulis sp.]|nr:hypothetical protein [Ponticaulis sp.]|tara:strand:- start:44793 stop:45083 length:291 start_codon:yes stop_codon:yes gene_type:complete